MLVGSVKNASLFQKFTLNLIGFGVCDLGEPIRCHSSLPVSLIQLIELPAARKMRKKVFLS